MKAYILWAAQRPVSWWRQVTNDSETASQAAVPAAASPAVAFKAASSPIADAIKAAIPGTRPETPAAATLPAASKAKSIAARLTAAKPAEAEPPVRDAQSSEPAVSMGSCPAQDVRAVHYTAAVGAALLSITVIWSLARRMVPARTRCGVYWHKCSPLALEWSPQRKGRRSPPECMWQLRAGWLQGERRPKGRLCRV